MDTVKEHGPCAGVTEDHFEKSHGALRNHFSYKIKRQGDGTQFHNKLRKRFLYILEGGYHKTESGWYVHKHIKNTSSSGHLP